MKGLRSWGPLDVVEVTDHVDGYCKLFTSGYCTCTYFSGLHIRPKSTPSHQESLAGVKQSLDCCAITHEVLLSEEHSVVRHEPLPILYVACGKVRSLPSVRAVHCLCLLQACSRRQKSRSIHMSIYTVRSIPYPCTYCAHIQALGTL